MADDFTPELVDRGAGWPLYAKVLIEVDRCGACGQPMLPEAKPFSPVYVGQQISAQAKRAGWPLRGTAQNGEGETICQDCEQAGGATFTCALCGEERPSSQIQNQYGDPAEYLCAPCYETMPAKVWLEKDSELHHAHQWDFE